MNNKELIFAKDDAPKIHHKMSNAYVSYGTKGSIKDLCNDKGTHSLENYYRVHFPSANLNQLLNVKVDFDPFKEDTYCFVEIHSGAVYVPSYRQRYTLTFIIVKTDTDSFDEKDYSIVDTAIVECFDYNEVNNFIKNNIVPLFKNNIDNFKSYLETKPKLSRYIPSDMKQLIEAGPKDVLVVDICQFIKNVLEAVDTDESNRVIDYENLGKLLENDIIEMCTNLLHKIFILPNNLFKIFTTDVGDIESYRADLLKCLDIGHNYLILAISQLKNIFAIFHELDLKHTVKEQSMITELDSYNMWEIVKTLQKHLVRIYAFLKKQSDIEDDTDIDINWGLFEAIDMPMTGITVPETNDNVFDNVFSTENNFNYNINFPSSKFPYDYYYVIRPGLSMETRNTYLSNFNAEVPFETYRKLVDSK